MSSSGTRSALLIVITVIAPTPTADLPPEDLAQARGRPRRGIGANAPLLLADRVEGAVDGAPHDVRVEVHTLRGRRLADTPPAFQLRLFAHGEHLTQAPYATPVPPCAYR